jgi:hypothetical protein
MQKNILSIPLKNGMADTLACHFDPKGDFSVKFAYHVLTNKKELSKRRQIETFSWRFTHNSLPLRMNILHRGMDIDTHYPVYWRLNEDSGHCFLRCKFVKKYWRALNLEELHLAFD